MLKKVVIIDLGSNTARLVLLQIYSNGSYRLLDEFKKNVRIIENINCNKKINAEAIKRTLNAVKIFRNYCNSCNVDEVICVTTAGIRNASNGKEIIDLIHNETGLKFRTLSGKEEAFYGYLGVVNTLKLDHSLIVDIGGGSTEITLCERKKMVNSISIPYGAVNLTNMFPNNYVNEPNNIDILNNFITAQFESISWLKNATGFDVVGVGGTMRNIGRIDRGKTNYSFGVLNDYHVSKKAVGDIYSNLQTMPISERKRIPDLSRGREDIIVSGVSIASNLMNYISSEKLRISGSGLREGVFYEKYLKYYTNSIADDVVEHSVQNLMDVYQVRKDYVQKVSRLSVALFDQLSTYYEFGEFERKLLRIASLLHTLGTAVSFYGFQEHTLYILLNINIDGLTHREHILTALICANHKKICLEDYFRKYEDILLSEDSNIVEKLGSILKTAIKINRENISLAHDILNLAND
ncbi:MAG: Ppx/GppA family phosphatase [Clostridiales bacterium]|nr:Ppx/GppA family phosphatase [Clostridiales bacterium]